MSFSDPLQEPDTSKQLTLCLTHNEAFYSCTPLAHILFLSFSLTASTTVLLNSYISSYTHHLPARQFENDVGQLVSEKNQWNIQPSSYELTVPTADVQCFDNDLTCLPLQQPLFFLFYRWAWRSTEENVHQMDKCTVLQGNVKHCRPAQCNSKPLKNAYKSISDEKLSLEIFVFETSCDRPEPEGLCS